MLLHTVHSILYAMQTHAGTTCYLFLYVVLTMWDYILVLKVNSSVWAMVNMHVCMGQLVLG